MARRSNVWLAVTLGSVIALCAALLFVMWRLGFFNFSGSDPSSKVVAAALALVGTFIGTVVSIVGTLLKHSIDQQTERRLQIESERNAALKEDEKKRLKLEVAVRTLQLFSNSAGQLAPDMQRDGALFALSSLGEYELTLLIAESMLVDKTLNPKLNPNTFTTLLNDAILQGSDEIKNSAIDLFHRHANKMLIGNGMAIPRALLSWRPELTDYVREWGVAAIARAMLARPVTEWSRDLHLSVNTLLAVLCLAWEEAGENQLLRNNVGAILRALFEAFPETENTLHHPSKRIDAAGIKAHVAGSKAESTHFTELVERLSRWTEAKDHNGHAQSHRQGA